MRDLGRCSGTWIALAALLIGGCGGSSTPATPGEPTPGEPAPLGAPMSGLDDGTEVVFGHGMARSLAGIERVWSSGVRSPYAIFFSSAELSCGTDLQAKNSPQGYTLRITFDSLDVGATADDFKLYRHANGWFDTSGNEGPAEAKITATSDGTFSGTVSIDWKWRVDDAVGSLKGDFEVVSCLEP